MACWSGASRVTPRRDGRLNTRAAPNDGKSGRDGGLGFLACYGGFESLLVLRELIRGKATG